MSEGSWIFDWLIFGAAVALSAALTGVARLISGRVGFVDDPKKHRWNTRKVPLGGGFAIVASILVVARLLRLPYSVELAGPFLAIAMLGAVDDFFRLPPTVKLLVQIGAAGFAVSRGFHFSLGSPALSSAFSVFWIVGFTNSVNLLDNMDGVSSGICAIASVGMGFILRSNPATQGLAPIAFLAGGASLGFLIHNFHPAKIFMGDTGSLALGFVIGALSTRISGSGIGGRTDFTALVSACLVLAVPILDTFLVMMCRIRNRRPIMLGGRDHCTHRLVRIGFSERHTALALYLISCLGGANAYLASTLSAIWLAILLPPAFFAFVLYLKLLIRIPCTELVIDKKP